MLERLLKLYVTAMEADVRSPTPHLFGPPGCGKSTAVEQMAELLRVNLHVINVSRLSPLEVEGVQMPVEDNTRLHMIPASFWSRLKAGDIVLFDEFLRGFPEVYNGLLDIFTSRRAGHFRLPPVFIVAASNSTVAYDKALEDRLLHLKVDDPRSSKRAKTHLARLAVDAIGLMPDMVGSMEMLEMLDREVLPTFDMLDDLAGRPASPALIKGRSLRNLIGQARLREAQAPTLHALLTENNRRALAQQKLQYVVMPDGRSPMLTERQTQQMKQLLDSGQLTPLQASNLQLNLQLVEMEEARNEGDNSDDKLYNLGDDAHFR